MGSKAEEISGRGYLFFFGDLIEYMKINTGSESLILFINKETPSPNRGGVRANDASG